MRRRDAGKVASLHAGEPKIDERVRPAVDPDLGVLSQLRALDEQVEAAGHAPLLLDMDRSIIDACLLAGRIDCAALALTLRVHRSTVWRRVQRLLASAATIDRYGKTLLDETTPQPWHVVMAIARTLAGAPGALDPGRYSKLAAMYRAGFDARRLLYPATLTVERRGEKLIITGPGPLLPILEEWVRAGEAEHIFPGPPRCHTCGKFIARPPTGRPPKYCGERCRSRYRRRR